MNPLNMLFGQIASAITNHSSPNTPGPSYDANPLLGQLSGLFGQTASQHGLPFDQNDEYSQQGGGQFGNVQSSDQDPLGDPGAMDGQGGAQNVSQQFGNVLSSDQDPYGDPGAQR